MSITQPLFGSAIGGLNNLAAVAGDVKLGNLLVAMIAAHNQLQADHNTLRGQYLALLAHMDAGNVTGLGNADVANYSAAASAASAPTVGSLQRELARWEQRYSPEHTRRSS
jgi:hypothetical protein